MAGERRARDRLETPLRERDVETRALAQVLGAARRGNGSAHVLKGPAGIGKTSLLRWLATNAASTDCLVMRARGTREGASHTYSAVLDLYSPAVFHSRGQMSFHGACELALTLIDTGTTPPGGEFAFLHGLYWLTVSLSEAQPLVLLCDDIQWCDDASLRALRHLAERSADLPVLIVGAVRAGEPLSEAAVAFVDTVTTVVEPHELSADAVAGMLTDVPRDAIATIAARSGGNPFLVQELKNYLQEHPDRAVASAVPPNVVTTIDQRLRALDPAERNVLMALVVLGERDTSIAEIGDLVGADHSEVSRVVDQLRERALVSGHGPLAFAHPLYRDAVERAMRPHERQRLEKAAACARHVDRPIHAASHILAAPDLCPMGEDWVVPTLVRAAEDAAGRGGFDEAERYLRRTLREPLEAPVAFTIRLHLGSVLHQKNDAQALEHLARAQALAPDDVAAGTAALARSEALFHFGDLVQAAAVAETAAAAAIEDQPGLRTALEVAALNAGSQLGLQRPHLADDAARTSGRVVDVAERALAAHIAWDRAVRGVGPHTAVIDLARRSLAVSFDQPDVLHEELYAADPSLVYACNALSWAGDFSGAELFTTQAIERASARGSVLGVAYATAARAGNGVYRGDIRGAAIDVRSALDHLPQPDLMYHLLAVGWEIEVAIEQERAEEVRDRIIAEGVDGSVPDIGAASAMLISRARLWAELGEWDRLRADTEEVAVRSERAHYISASSTPWRSLSVPSLLAAGRRAYAEELVHEELTHAERFGSPRAIGVALRALATCRPDPESAIADLVRATEVLSDADAELVLAGAQIDLATHAGSGSVRHRQSQLRDAMERAYRCGSEREVRRAMRALRDTGARPRRPVRSGPDALTPQELQVARLASGGMGNREIAEALFVTRRTVELHLTNVYRKLHIDGRSQLESALVLGRSAH
ncbi:LuxR family transcriptional regulator [Microbacterium sediminicola]|uniref:LuxR family transcriptional regulator n=1 Tax=Microbacterium sediminicola TaxID=415210 RepID=A0ABN2I465_9MICO